MSVSFMTRGPLRQAIKHVPLQSPTPAGGMLARTLLSLAIPLKQGISRSIESRIQPSYETRSVWGTSNVPQEWQFFLQRGRPVTEVHETAKVLTSLSSDAPTAETSFLGQALEIMQAAMHVFSLSDQEVKVLSIAPRTLPGDRGSFSVWGDGHGENGPQVISYFLGKKTVSTIIGDRVIPGFSNSTFESSWGFGVETALSIYLKEPLDLSGEEIRLSAKCTTFTQGETSYLVWGDIENHLAGLYGPHHTF